MAPVVASESPPLSPRSPPRKKAKFSLRLKGKKIKNEDEKPKADNVFPIFSSPSTGNDENQDYNNSLLEPEIPSLPHAGLLNQGNTCYANAVLQILRCCPGFGELVGYLAYKEKEVTNDKQITEKKNEAEQLIFQLDELLCQMCTFEEDFLQDKENCIHLSTKGNNLVLAAETLNFMEAFRELYPAFESNLQHDAQEFLCSLIMALQASAASKAKQKTNSINCDQPSCLPKKMHSKTNQSSCDFLVKVEKNISVANSMENLFQGKLVHQTKCLNCEESKLRYEDFQDVSVPVVEDQPYLDARKKLMLSPTPKKNGDRIHTLQWAIAQFASIECLQADNKYFCENCNTYCEAEIRTCFDKLPIILTIHLKRFTSSVGLSSKITSNLQTPFILSVQEWCSKNCQLECNEYELFGIVVHSGMTSGSGHYETYVRLTNHLEDDYEHPIANSSGKSEKECEGKTISFNKTDCFENNDEISNNYASYDALQNGLKVDINGNCIFNKETKLKGSAKNKRKRNRKSKTGTEKNENDTEVAEKSPEGFKDSKRKRLEDCGLPETLCSPIVDRQPQAQMSCMSVITRYFQRSRKVSSQNQSEKEAKTHPNKVEKKEIPSEKGNENSNMDVDEKNVEEHGTAHEEKEVMMNESSLKENLINPKVYGNIESFFQKTSSLQNGKNISKSPAIRKLTFQENSIVHQEKKDCPNNSSEEDVQIINSTCRNQRQSDERLKTGWVHFDDCTVTPISEQEILSILSSSDSSFSSPYLLFYRQTTSQFLKKDAGR